MLLTLIILTILILNLLVVFTIKSRVNMIIFISIANLTTLLLYSLKIDDFVMLKELAVATIFYSIIISFLIISHKEYTSKFVKKSVIDMVIYITLALITALACFHIAININNNLDSQKEKLINEKIINMNQIQEIKITNPKFRYLQNPDSKNSALFNHFGDFIIIICAIITFLFLSIKHQKE